MVLFAPRHKDFAQHGDVKYLWVRNRKTLLWDAVLSGCVFSLMDKETVLVDHSELLQWY